MGSGPLADSRLQEIESKLNAGRFDEAQRLLSTIGNLPNAESASAYFATRLLFQRGRMDSSGVIERLRELLVRVPHFPEAARMLAAAEAGVLEPAVEVFRRVTAAPGSEVPERVPPERAVSQRDIPRAPLVPRFTPRTGTPSYAPTTPLAPRDPTAPPMPMVPELGTLRGVGPVQAPVAVERATTSKEREQLPTISAPAVGLPIIPSLQVPTINTVSTLPPPQVEPPVSAPQPKPSVRSGAYSLRPHGASLLEISAALDAGNPQRALELSEQASSDSGPELGLLAARALLALGEHGRAAASVERSLRIPDLPAPLRATAARILLETGRVDAALEQAKRALAQDPSDPLSQVTCAWALTRALRRRGERALATEAKGLLDGARLREGPLSALALGLRAALAAEAKDATAALSLAHSALALDPRQADAIAAIALASAALGKAFETERAQKRLREVDADEARANEAALARHGLRPEPAPAATSSASPWGDAEAALLTGNPRPALDALTQAASECLRGIGRRGGPEVWKSVGRSAAQTLTQLPVFRHFAPYDCSVFSVERLEAALSLLFASRAPRAPGGDVLLQWLGAYVGESWRQAFGAEWEGTPAQFLSARIEGIGLSEQPCERIRERLERGLSLDIETPHALHPGADPLGNSVPLSLVPPAPWDPRTLPDIEQFSSLGRSLEASVIGLYCERALGLPLDLSISGAVAIDRYVALLAPPNAPPDPQAGWGQRVALLVGAYLGEVLVDAVAAHWDPVSDVRSLDAYRLMLPNGSVATPVVRVLDRLAGRRTSPLSEYAARLASGRTSVSA